MKPTGIFLEKEELAEIRSLTDTYRRTGSDDAKKKLIERKKELCLAHAAPEDCGVGKKGELIDNHADPDPAPAEGEPSTDEPEVSLNVPAYPYIFKCDGEDIHEELLPCGAAEAKAHELANEYGMDVTYFTDNSEAARVSPDSQDGASPDPSTEEDPNAGLTSDK